MAVIIEELSTSFHIQDEVKIRRLVREELKKALQEQRRGVGPNGSQGVDPSDPAAGGSPNEG